MKSFRVFLIERLLDVNIRDINLLADPIIAAVAPLHKALSASQRNVDRIKEAASELFEHEREIKIIPSSRLISPLAKDAHNINPIKIHIFAVVKLNVYVPSEDRISLGASAAAVHGAWNIEHIPEYQHRQLTSEFSPLKIRSTVRHELTHWIDDSLHNLHLSRISDLSMSKKDAKMFHDYVRAGQADTYLGHIEITALVNQIAEIKRHLPPEYEWDEMTWDDLLELAAPLRHLDDKLGQVWRQKVWQRMVRERLMGKNMRRLR